MGGKIEPRTLKGFRDTMPAEASARNRMFRAIEGVFESFGYTPIDTPALEFEEVLKGKGGDESDKQMFAFEDQGGRRVALRFDLTVPLARFVAEHQADLPLPFRRYHIGTVWRGERPQKGRFREFHQCDADLIGAVGPSADAEILTMYASVYETLRIGDFEIRVNDRRILNGLLSGLGIQEKSMAVLRVLDKWDKVGRAGVAEELKTLGISDPIVASIAQYAESGGGEGSRGPAANDAALARLESLVGDDPVGKEGVASLRESIRVATAAGVGPTRLRVDPTIARGLDYYTGIVFEAALLSAAGFGSIGSGGRYDDLASLYTNTRLPGVGCSIGLSRLLVALMESGQLGVAGARGVLVTHPEAGSDVAATFVLAAAVRRAGFAVETYPEPRKHAAQMKFADRKGLRFALTLDAGGAVHGKDLKSSESFDAADAAAVVAELERRA